MELIYIGKYRKVSMYTQVDAEDYKKFFGLPWKFKKSGKKFYVGRAGRKIKGKATTIWLHREILGLPKYEKGGLEGDHIDGDGLNNQRYNLRPVTRNENAQNSKKSSRNTSGFIGVDWVKKEEKWRARITKDKKSKFLGLFECKFEAALVRDDEAIKLGGKHKLNFPDRNTGEVLILMWKKLHGSKHN